MNNYLNNQNLANLFNGEIDLTKLKITNPSNTGVNLQSNSLSFTGDGYEMIADNKKFVLNNGSVRIEFDKFGLNIYINNVLALTLNSSTQTPINLH